MSQKLRRGGTQARKAAAKASSARRVAAAKARTGSAFDGVMALLPFSEEQLHRIFLVLILAAAAGLVWLVASIAGVPALASQQVTTLASEAGFEVHHVEVRGTRHLNEMEVYERVLTQRDRAMPQVNLDAIRADLLNLPWVLDARVSRQLPDTLVVDVVERQAHAVLRRADGSLMLIDATGHLLEPISPARVHGRLVLAGDGVEGEVGVLSALLEAAPALKPQVAAGEWVGNRRWNLTFKTGQVLALPEGDNEAAHALVRFAQMDGTNRLLGGKVAAFDMRAPDRIYLRVPGLGEEPGGAGVKPALATISHPETAATPTASTGAN